MEVETKKFAERFSLHINGIAKLLKGLSSDFHEVLRYLFLNGLPQKVEIFVNLFKLNVRIVSISVFQFF